MTSDLEPTEAGPPRPRPVQFTVRTFLAAAVLVSLFAAAAAIPKEEVRVCGLALLVWLTLAGLYHILRKPGLITALTVAPVVLAIGWLLSLSTFASMRHQEVKFWMVVPFAVEWAVVVSLLLALASGLRRLAGRLRRNPFRALGASPFASPAPADALPAWKVAAGLLGVRLAVAGPFIAAGILLPPQMVETVLVLCLAVDTPLVPLLVNILYPSPPSTSTGFLLLATALSCPVYALTGWLIALVAGRQSRRRRRPAYAVA